MEAKHTSVLPVNRTCFVGTCELKSKERWRRKRSESGVRVKCEENGEMQVRLFLLTELSLHALENLIREEKKRKEKKYGKKEITEERRERKEDQEKQAEKVGKKKEQEKSEKRRKKVKNWMTADERGNKRKRKKK